MSNGKRYEKDGRKIGGSRWDNHYSDRFFVYTQDSIQIVKDYIESMSKVNDIVELINKIEKQWFKTLYDLPEDKINILHKTMTEIFEMSEDD
jgi:dTDP-4-dehydrorhamnose reductase